MSDDNPPIERGSPEWQKNVDAMLESMKQTILEKGHAVQGVFGDDTFFAYTVGRVTIGAPEIYGAGNIDPQDLCIILNTVCLLIDEGELDIASVAEAGVEYVGVLAEGVPVKFIRCDPEKAEMNINLRMYGEYPKEAYQVIFPDPDGYFPGDPEYNTAYEQRVCPA